MHWNERTGKTIIGQKLRAFNRKKLAASRSVRRAFTSGRRRRSVTFLCREGVATQGSRWRFKEKPSRTIQSSRRTTGDGILQKCRSKAGFAPARNRETGWTARSILFFLHELQFYISFGGKALEYFDHIQTLFLQRQGGQFVMGAYLLFRRS